MLELVLSIMGVVVVVCLLAWLARTARRNADDSGLDSKAKPWWFGGGGGGKPL
jgi:hypothetical protein